MLIRCEKCSTLYELDDALLPPEGAPVQCSRCQYVFTARPERPPVPAAEGEGKAPGDGGSRDGTAIPTESPTENATATETPNPSANATATPNATAKPAANTTASPDEKARETASSPPSSPVSPAAPERSSAPPPSAAEPAPAEAPRFTADGRPIRKVPFPEEEVTASGPRPVIARAPGGVLPRRGPRAGGLPLVPIAGALVAVAVLLLAWRFYPRRPDPDAAGRLAEGLQLVLRDDRVSLTRAILAFDDAARLDERQVDARADRVLARALLLGLVQGEAARLEVRLAARRAERARTEAPVGPPVPELAEQIDALEAQREAVRGRLRELEGVAATDLASLQRRDAERPSVQRARAVLEAYATDPARAAEAVLRDRPARGKDPWLDLAVGAGETRAMSPELRAEGVARLEKLVKTHPELLRARLALAEALARAGRVEAAVASLDALLGANRDHEDARALRAELTTGDARGGAEAPVPGARVPAGSPPPEAAAPHPRNESSQASPP